MFIFQFLMMKLQLYQKKPYGTWQFGKIGVSVHFIIQKLKSKHLVCLSFFGERLNLRGLSGFILQKVRTIGVPHKVNITEGASAQFLIWILNFWQNGQLRAVWKKIRPIMSKF